MSVFHSCDQNDFHYSITYRPLLSHYLSQCSLELFCDFIMCLYMFHVNMFLDIKLITYLFGASFFFASLSLSQLAFLRLFSLCVFRWSRQTCGLGSISLRVSLGFCSSLVSTHLSFGVFAPLSLCRKLFALALALGAYLFAGFMALFDAFLMS